MGNEIVKKEDASLQEAYAAKEISVGLTNYLQNGRAEEEERLVNLLNQNKSLVGRVFKTVGQKKIEQFAIEDLQQIRKNRSQYIQLHHDMAIEHTKLQASAILQGAGVHYQEQLAAFATAKIESIIRTIRESQKRMNTEFANDETEANMEFAGNDKYLQRAIKQIDKAAAVHMESTDSMLDGVVNALKNHSLSLKKTL